MFKGDTRSADSEDQNKDERQNNGGRKSNEEIKRQIFSEGIMDSLENILKSCSRNCPLKGQCNRDVSVKDVYDARINFLGSQGTFVNIS